MNRIKEVCKLYESGITLQKIGEKFGVSRQRIWQIIKPFYKKLDKDKRHEGAFANKFSQAIIPNKHEIYLYRKLSRLGFNVELQPYNAPFDLLVNGKKVQVKYRVLKRKWRVRFSYLKDKEEADFLILTMIKGKYKKSWIFPKGTFSNFKNLAWKKKYKTYNTKYIEKWDLLKD